jgi:hypothetical protein
MTAQDKVWRAIHIPDGLGLECSKYKFRQSQSNVEVFILVPWGIEPKKVARTHKNNDFLFKRPSMIITEPSQVKVILESKKMTVSFGDEVFMKATLQKDIQQSESMWFVIDGVLQIRMLKKSRKGQYRPGTTNADTWWQSLTAIAGPLESIALHNPPTKYYWTECDDLDSR